MKVNVFTRDTTGVGRTYFAYSTDLFFFFKQKTAYEMRISDWSSDVCSSDLLRGPHAAPLFGGQPPLTLITSGAQDNLVAVRRFLDAARGGLYIDRKSVV